jgi:hypothetical protein
MEKITLKLLEYYSLDLELNGAPGADTNEPNGLLKEKLSIVTKYWLTDLAKKVATEKEAIENIKNDLIKKYGDTDKEGNIAIPMIVEEKNDSGETEKKVNPNYQAFEKEFFELLQTEKDLEYKPLKLSDFENLETSNNYTTLFKLITP